jgi:hypothetical protein
MHSVGRASIKNLLLRQNITLGRNSNKKDPPLAESSKLAMTTVGLINHNGQLGSAVMSALAPHAQKGDIKLVVLHRPSSDLSKVPHGVETRVLDLEKGDKAELKEAVKGLNIVM